MPLTSGAKLGPYEIVCALGAGGMGEVYRARDSRLDRTVAIKILATHLSASPDLKQRFEREARTLSSLSHPNICHLYDVGSQDGVDFLVMEFLEGETLAHRLQRGELPLNEVIRVGMEVAGALHVAHRAGIVHRDLKPGNVMLTKSGTKLMDFGLAKPAALAASASGSAPLLSAAMTASGPSPASPLTSAGTVIGTIQYMSPEQISGQAADARSDIFALGAVLYEMATGNRPFEGKSQISVASAILEKDPEPVSRVRAVAPPAFDYLVKSCLEKSPEDRIQTAHDVKLQLKWISANDSQATAARPATQIAGTKRARLLFVGMATLLVIAAVAGVAWWQARSPRQVIRATLLPPEGTHFALLNRNGPAALSPDGTQVAFIASRNSNTSLWIRALDKMDASELAGTDGAFFPFWSPDGHSVGYFAAGKMWRMSVNGGPAVAICDVSNGRGGSWNKDGVILFAPDIGTPIFRVSAAGGTPVEVTHPPRAQSNRWPVFLPDGKHFIYLMSPTGAADENNEVRYASLDGKETTLLRGDYYTPGYAMGWLLTVRSGILTAQKFDAGSGKLSGDPVPLADHVQEDGLVAGAVFSASENGTLLFQQGPIAAGERIILADAQGKELSQVADPGFYGNARLSPDASRAAYPIGPGNDLWVSDVRTGARTRISFGAKIANSPAWSPDGRMLYFSYFNPQSDGASSSLLGGAGGHVQVYERTADGSRPQQPLLKSDSDLFVADVSPDGKYLLYEDGNSSSSTLKALPLDGSSKPLVIMDHLKGFLGALAGPSNARVSPAGTWLAYESNESGRDEVYVTKFPSGGGKYQVSLAGGTMPVWSRDGKHLYYLDPNQKMTVADVQIGGDSIQIGKPVTLFQTGIRASIFGGGFDVTRDGRFLLINSTTENALPLNLVANWQAELKQ